MLYTIFQHKKSPEKKCNKMGMTVKGLKWHKLTKQVFAYKFQEVDDF